MAEALKSVNKELGKSRKGLQSSSSNSTLQVTPGKHRTNQFINARLQSESPAEKLGALQERQQKQTQYLEFLGQKEAAEQDDRNFLEKMLNLNKNQGFFGDIFEVLGRPGQAVKGFFDEEGTDANMFERAWKGFTGERRISGEAFMKDVFNIHSDNAVANWIIGFIGDIGTDPLMIFDAPYKLAGKAVTGTAKLAGKTAGKVISKLPGGEELLQKMLTIKNGAKNVIKDAFNIYNNKQYKNFAHLTADKQNTANLVREHAIKTLQNVHKEVDTIVEREFGKESNHALFKKITGKEKYTKADVKQAYLEQAYQHIESRGYDLTTKHVMDNLLDNVAKDGRATFGNAGVRNKKAFQKFEKELDPLKQRIEAMLGRKLGPEDFLVEMSRTGKGAFLKLSPEATKGLQKHKELLAKTAQDIKKYGIDNVMLGKMKEWAETGKLVLNIANPEEKLLLNKLTKLLGDKNIKLNATGGMVEINGLTRKHLAKFLDDPENMDLIAFLTDKFKLNDYDYQLAMRTTGVPFMNKADNSIANKIVKSLKETGAADGKQVVEVMGVSESAQQSMVAYTNAIKELETVNEKLVTIGASKADARLLANANFKFQEVVNILEGVKSEIYKIPELIGDKSLGKIAEGLHIDGYMRHIASPDTILMKKLERLDSTDPEALALIREVAKGDTNKELLARKWHGSAKDINEMLGIKLFDTDPIASIAVNMKMLPDRFLAANLLTSALDTGMIRQLNPEEGQQFINLIKENPNMTHRNAFEKVLPPEYRLLDEEAVIKLKNSYSFLLRAGATSEEVAYLTKHLNGILENGGIIHRGVYNKIVSYGKRLSETGVNELISATRKYFIDPWKKAALFSVGYHMRNFLSNGMNAYLAGIPMKSYAVHFGRATKDLYKMERTILPKLKKMVLKGDARLKTLEGQIELIGETLSKEELKLFNEYVDYSSKSLVGANKFTSDHYDLLHAAENIGKKKNIISRGYKATLGKMVDGSFKLGKLSDEASRIATYRWGKTQKGVKHLEKMGIETPEQFAKFTFFDFNDLSPFEQKVMKAIFPFYTWARKNIEFHIRNFMKQPARYARTNYMLNNWKTSMIDDEDKMSEWAKKDSMIPLFESDGRITYLKMKPSYMEFEDTLHNPLIALSPLVKLPLEKLTGSNFFTHKEFSGLTTGAMNDIFGKPENMAKIFDPTEDTNSYGPGILATRLGGAVSPIMKFLGLKGEGINTAADVIPSMFKEEDATANQIYNIQARIIQRNKYLQNLKRQGRYIPSQSDVFGVRSTRPVGSVRSTMGYIPKIGKKR